MSNREIKFRGIGKETGEWVYGYYAKFPDGSHSILNGDIWVDVMPEAVGQFTGMHDQNGKEIYEGDIIRAFTYFEMNSDAPTTKGRLYHVIYNWLICQFTLKDLEHKTENSLQGFEIIEITGNIHDGKEGT